MTAIEPAPIKGAKGRERLLHAALVEFYERGYHGSNIRDIAARASVTPASLYHHFKGKQDLLSVTMTTIMQDVLDITEVAMMVESDGASARLRRLVEAWVGFHARHQMAAAVGAAELISLEEPGRAVVVSMRDHQETRFREVIEVGILSGEFTTPNASIAAKAVVAMGTFVASWYNPAGSQSPDHVAAVYGDVALATVGASTR